MSSVLRPNRKGSDRDILRLNAVGLSLAAIADRIGCHPTSITLRLKNLKIRPADTRRSFMEGVFKGLPENSPEIIADTLEARAPMNIQDYVRELIASDLERRQHNTQELALA